MAKPKGLGKGLDALFFDNNTGDSGVRTLKISSIEPNRSQPRSDFDEEALRELADSVKQHGVLQPLLVRPLESGAYQIVAGERRWRASRMAGLSEVPVVVREMEDNEALEFALIENLQREDLNPVELARGYKALMEEHGMTQDDVARRMGKSRSAVANILRLLALPAQALEYLRQGRLSVGQAKAILALADAAAQNDMTEKAADGRLTVREIELIARRQREEAKATPARPKAEGKSPWGDSFYAEVELALTTELGRKVRIEQKGRKGVLTLEFYSKEELEKLADRLVK